MERDLHPKKRRCEHFEVIDLTGSDSDVGSPAKKGNPSLLSAQDRRFRACEDETKSTPIKAKSRSRKCEDGCQKDEGSLEIHQQRPKPQIAAVRPEREWKSYSFEAPVLDYSVCKIRKVLLSKSSASIALAAPEGCGGLYLNKSSWDCGYRCAQMMVRWLACSEPAYKALVSCDLVRGSGSDVTVAGIQTWQVTNLTVSTSLCGFMPEHLSLASMGACVRSLTRNKLFIIRRPVWPMLGKGGLIRSVVLNLEAAHD